MPRRIIAAIAAFTIAAASIASIACSGGETPPETGAGRAPPAQAQPESAPQGPGPVRVTRPTRPPRLDLSRTGTPAETRQTGETQSAQPTARAAERAQDAPAQTQPPAAQADGAPAETTEKPAGPPDTAGVAPEDLIPENPETNDEVLLQDIYALMDLDRFALDPGAPIQLPSEKSFNSLTSWSKGYPDSIFELDEVENHPYLHLFPGLRWTAEKAGKYLKTVNRGGTFVYNPYDRDVRNYPKTGKPSRTFQPRDGNTHFIYHPWFEPLDLYEITEGTKLYRGQKMDGYRRIRGKNEDGQNIWISIHSPHWFGKNSTRGVLSEAVAEALAEAKKPGAEDHDLLVQAEHPGFNRRGQKTEYGAGWSLAEYLRTPMVVGETIGQLKKQYYHELPATQWEFLHPRLPIIRVTNFVRTQMPFRVPGEKPGHSDIAVSFVVSFQNRWASFDDPNRWLFRFEEDMREIHSVYERPGNEFDKTREPGILGGIDEETHQRLFPRYWHSSDYMQHRIIGPVVVQVYEHDREGDRSRDPLQHGIYHAYPKAAEWEAPGPILQDEQLRVTFQLTRGTRRGDLIEILRPEPAAQSPNPGWPLPGHVMTHPGTGPGTGVWEDFKLDGHEW